MFEGTPQETKLQPPKIFVLDVGYLSSHYPNCRTATVVEQSWKDFFLDNRSYISGLMKSTPNMCVDSL